MSSLKKQLELSDALINDIVLRDNDLVKLKKIISWCQELVGTFLTSKNYLILIHEKKDRYL